MRHRDTVVVVSSVHVFIVTCISAIIDSVIDTVHFVVLIHVPRLEALIGEVLTLCF